MMTPHPQFKEFLAALKRLTPPITSFDGTLFRASDPLYANARDLITGHGSRRYGGRWNGPGIATVYLAQSVEGAIAESLGLAGSYGFDPAKRLPLTLVAIDARLNAVFDFTHARVRKSVGITLTAMNACEWRMDNAAGEEALTQALGRAAYELGVEGVLVPSAVKRTFIDLNVFPENLRNARQLTVRSSERLPPPPAPSTL